jgi:hypothetical protein
VKLLRDESGQVIVLAILCLAAALGFVAFATDVGLLFRERQLAQTAADSAALAGAAEYNNGDWCTAAQQDAAQNGVSNAGGIGSCAAQTTLPAVTVNTPPKSGPNSGNAGYVEVLVSMSQPTFFMKMFHLSAVTVGARAVAATVPLTNCIYTLGSSGKDIDMTGSGNLTLTNCSILDDSSSSNALNLTGSGNISAKTIGIVGNYNVTGSGSVSPTPNTGMTSVGNPLSLTAPSAGSCSAAFSNTGSSSVTITGPSTPGGIICYNGISNTGSGTITFPAGIYVINGNFSNTGSGGLSGTGVTFYLSGSNQFSITGSGAINLSAPTTGNYSGILFYQDPNDNQTMSITGSSSGTFSGIFYAPAAELDLTGSSGVAFDTDLIVNSLKITGSVDMSDYAPAGGVSPLSTPTVVE